MTGPAAPSDQAAGLVAALDASGRTVDDLAAVLPLPDGVSVEDVLAGRHNLSMDGLLVAAAFLDAPVSVVAGRVPPSRSLAVSLRLGQVETAAGMAGTLAKAAAVLSYRDLIVSWDGPPSRPLEGFAPSRDRHAITAGRNSAARVRDLLGLADTDPLADLIRLVEAQGHPVLHADLPEGVHGVAVRDERLEGPVWAVLVAVSVPWTRQRWTIAHELSHVLHADAGQVVVEHAEAGDALPEVRAEAFARHLLLPPAALAQAARRSGRDWLRTVPQVMVDYGISRAAVVNALVADGIVAQHELAAVNQSGVSDMVSRAGLQDRWRELSAREHETQGSPWLVGRAADLYARGLVGADVVADLMDTDEPTAVAELRRLGWQPAHVDA